MTANFLSRSTAVALATAAIIFAGCGASRETASTQPVGFTGSESNSGPTRGGSGIAAGELLEVYVLEDDTLSGRYEVRSSGHIIFPKVGRVHVAGLSPSAAEAAVKRALETNQLKNATVMVERVAGHGTPAVDGVTVFLSGSIQSPGRRTIGYVSGQRPTLYQGILEAGGFNRFADQRRVTLNRKGQDGRVEPIKVDITKVRAGTATDVPLEDGDIIFVPEKTFGW